MKCLDADTTKLFQAAVDGLVKLMQKNDTDPEIAMLVKGPQLRGESTMQAVASPFLPSKYHHDKLG